MADEARALLAAAARQHAVDTARVRAFARAVLEADQVSALALAVLDGGLFAGRRVIELARQILAVRRTSGSGDADCVEVES